MNCSCGRYLLCPTGDCEPEDAECQKTGHKIIYLSMKHVQEMWNSAEEEMGYPNSQENE